LRSERRCFSTRMSPRRAASTSAVVDAGKPEKAEASLATSAATMWQSSLTHLGLVNDAAGSVFSHNAIPAAKSSSANTPRMRKDTRSSEVRSRREDNLPRKPSRRMSCTTCARGRNEHATISAATPSRSTSGPNQNDAFLRGVRPKGCCGCAGDDWPAEPAAVSAEAPSLLPTRRRRNEVRRAELRRIGRGGWSSR